jgi:site-specific recombinase XerD
MFNQLFEKEYTIQRHLNYPFLKERLQYLQYWHVNGATTNTLQQIARNLLIIVDFLDLKNKRSKFTILEIEERASKWDKHFYKRSKKKDYAFSTIMIYRLVRIAIHWLGMLEMIRKNRPQQNLFSKQLLKYATYRREERGLSEITIKNETYLLEYLFKNNHDKNHLLKKINCIAIDKILEKKHVEGYSRRSIQRVISTLRTFLIYSENQGWCTKGISASIFTPRTYGYETLPQSPSWNNVKKLLAITNENNPTNIRDRAILMLLSIYGLRNSEVRKLKLNDIDWENEEILLIRAKNAKSQKLPLSNSVKKAILHYLKEVRQDCSSCKEVFLCLKAPYRPLGQTAIFQIVSRRWKLIDKTLKSYGPHSLRHACATHLINEEISLKEISDYLGHTNIDSTRIYTKVDLNNLRKVADFNIGDLL